MTKFILFNSIKGGVGKSTLVAKTVVYLARLGCVAVMDCDPQQNLMKKEKKQILICQTFYELYENYRVNWVNIRVRGVIILAILHYAKNKLNLDLNELLEEVIDERRN